MSASAFHSAVSALVLLTKHNLRLMLWFPRHLCVFVLSFQLPISYACAASRAIFLVSLALVQGEHIRYYEYFIYYMPAFEPAVLRS